MNSSRPSVIGEFGHHARRQASIGHSHRIHTYEIARQSKASARVGPNRPPTENRASPPAPPAPSLLIPLFENEVHGTLSLGVPHPLTVHAHRPRARLVRVVAQPTRRTAAKTYVPTRWGIGSRHLRRLLYAVLILSIPQLVRGSRTPCHSAKLLFRKPSRAFLAAACGMLVPGGGSVGLQGIVSVGSRGPRVGA